MLEYGRGTTVATVADGEKQTLRDVIHRLLAAALQADIDHSAELEHRAAELAEHDEAHADEVAGLRTAMDTRDLIGQAKGIIVATLRCTSEHAFGLLLAQSQHENRKVVEIAAEIVARAQHRPT